MPRIMSRNAAVPYDRWPRHGRHHDRVAIDHRQQPFDGLDHPRNDPPERFVDHGIDAMSEEIARSPARLPTTGHHDIAIGVSPGLRQQVRSSSVPGIERERMVEGQRRPGLAGEAEISPRRRGHVSAGRQTRTAIGMGEYRRTGRGKGAFPHRYDQDASAY